MTIRALASKIDVLSQHPGGSTVPGLSYVRRTEPTDIDAFVYDPIVCLILQGSKETIVGERQVHVGVGSCIIVSHDLPVVARISEASPQTPYLALVAKLDLSELRSLYDDVGSTEAPAAPEAYAVAEVDATLLDVMRRYVDLADDPAEARVLAPLVRRELHFRLLRASHGSMLRTLLHRDSHASNVARAIQRLRADFRDNLEVPALARAVGMSTSSFHKHFKQVTATTPLQYQKNLRLTEARRLLERGQPVSSTAFDVGYESATQFSREYSRKFGVPPSAHRTGASEAVAG